MNTLQINAIKSKKLVIIASAKEKEKKTQYDLSSGENR